MIFTPKPSSSCKIFTNAYCSDVCHSLRFIPLTSYHVTHMGTINFYCLFRDSPSLGAHVRNIRVIQERGVFSQSWLLGASERKYWLPPFLSSETRWLNSATSRIETSKSYSRKKGWRFDPETMTNSDHLLAIVVQHTFRLWHKALQL